MRNAPYGYMIKEGKAVINEEEASCLRELLQAYLSGLSLKDAGKKVGINRCHVSIAKMLTDKRYIEGGFYPAITEKELFDRAQKEKQYRAEKLGRVRKSKVQKRVAQRQTFTMPSPKLLHDDPFKQAEYAYSLIKSEVITDG